ncbi:GerAB/ArcD/ProY family transporter [Alkalibaculum sp. M08DMB]|uniref:GerAB/ArcD/ProY family transporter n=1 Tax=Alkalibaculum sporogenes TaxID=2655001 RepID=A0A6A7KBA9_9FIRM|nr:endospore germination permease [Alkalibaculum sporogenes]MPW26652.1 GerAB/ArcD/ProY family transporter [Alkalibaculum sporogenes]
MDKISPGHLIFLILGVSIVSIKTYPRVFIANGLRDTWVAVIISSIIIFAFFIYIMIVWKNSDEKNMIKLYQGAVGEKFGNVLIGLFVLTLFITLIESASVEADSMNQVMLIEVPKWYYLLFFIVPAIFIVRKNLIAIVIITMIGITFIMIAGINLGILTTKYKDASMLFPVFENGITSGFILAILETLGLYGCISITLPYLSKIQDRRGTIIRNVIIGLIILIQMEIMSTTGILTTFTPFRAATLNYPKLLQTQLVSYYQYFDFGELYVMLQIVGGWLLKYLISFFAILIIFRNYNMSKKHIEYSVFIISSLVLVASYYASRNSLLLFDLLNIYQYICLFNFVLVPFMVFAIVDVKSRLNILPDKDDKTEQST